MPNTEKMNILIVEDSKSDVMIIERALRKSGSEVKCELSVAVDGEEALNFLYRKGEFADAPRPDLILLDLRLPKKKGLDVLATIKQDEKLRRIPVIVLTHSTAEEDMARAYDSGAASYMNKPVDSKDFDRLIHTVQEYWRIATLPPEG